MEMNEKWNEINAEENQPEDVNVFRIFNTFLQHHTLRAHITNNCTFVWMAVGEPFNHDNQKDAEQFYLEEVNSCAMLRNLKKYRNDYYNSKLLKWNVSEY